MAKTSIVKSNLRIPKEVEKSLEGLNDRQRLFVLELLADESFDAANAAEKAGYKRGSAKRIIETPIVSRAIAKVQRAREKRAVLNSDSVLDFVRRALFFNPLKYFVADRDGKWVIEDPTSLPDEVGELIEEMKIKTTVDDEGCEIGSTFEVKIVSKSTVLPLAMKHLGLLVDKVEVSAESTLDWDSLLTQTQPPTLEDRPNVIVIDDKSQTKEN